MRGPRLKRLRFYRRRAARGIATHLFEAQRFVDRLEPPPVERPLRFVVLAVVLGAIAAAAGVAWVTLWP